MVGVNVGLVTAHDPVAIIPAAILNAGVAAFDLPGQPEFKIAEQSLTPDQKGVSLRWVLWRCSSHDGAIDNGPELGIPVPPGERLAIEELHESRLTFLSGQCVGRYGPGRRAQNANDCKHADKLYVTH